MAQYTDVFLFFVASLHIVVTLMIFTAIDQTQSTAYMDEYFHVPQAQQYCNGSFSEWDPKITTLPGLYLASIGLLKPIATLLRVELVHLCTVTVLRSINVVFATGCLLIMYHLLHLIHQPKTKSAEMKVILTAVTLSSFPLLYFFIFLYYTDVGSTFLVLLAYFFCLRGNHIMTSIISANAIFFRQTNVVWVVFMAGVTLARQMDLKEKPTPSDSIIHAVASAIQRGLRYVGSVMDIFKLITLLWSYAAVAVAFIAFVFANEGIVVGDRSNHQAVLNFPQLFYFAAFTAGFALPVCVSLDKIWRFLKSIVQNPFTYLTVLATMLVLIRHFTYVHPFTFADNRHYPFYIWRLVFMRHESVKFLLIPGYLFAGWTIRDSLSHKSETWQIVFFVCLMASLVPQQLLEFRYFLIPFLIFRLNCIHSYWHIIIEFILYSAVNIFTLYMFLHKPFYWPDSAMEQRFMW